MDSSNAGQLERTPSEKADVKSDSSLRLPTPPEKLSSPVPTYHSWAEERVQICSFSPHHDFGHDSQCGSFRGHYEGHLAYTLDIRLREVRP
jgi:hypothetical protein